MRSGVETKKASDLPVDFLLLVLVFRFFERGMSPLVFHGPVFRFFCLSMVELSVVGLSRQ